MLRDDTFDFMHPGLNRNNHIDSAVFGRMYSFCCLNDSPDSSKTEKVVLGLVYLFIFTHMSPLLQVDILHHSVNHHLDFSMENLIEKAVVALLQ